MGLALASMRGLLVIGEWIHARSTGRPIERASPEVLVRSIIIRAVLWAIGGVAIVSMLVWMGQGSSARWMLLPVPLLLLPFLEAFLRPWLEFMRVPVPRATPAPEAWHRLTDWGRSVARQHGIPNTDFVLWPGSVRNAFTVGIPPFGRWIVVGEALLAEMTTDEMRAVLAHELAHTIRHDTARLFAAATAIILAQVGAAWVLAPALSSLGPARPVIWGAAFGGVLALGLGFISRRIEYRADQLAATITGDPRTLCQALERLAEIANESPQHPTNTHPSIEQRVKRLCAHG